MKSILKWIFIISLIAILNGCYMQAEVRRELRVDQAQTCYRELLSHENPGVVESSIMQIMKMKMRYPEKNCRLISRKLRQLSLNGPSQAIRYKAFIVESYLRNPDWIEPFAANQTMQDPNLFFKQLSRDLNSRLLAYY